MRRTAAGMIGGLLLLITSAIGMSAQSPQTANPITGTWKFNPQKSKLTNTLPPRSLVRKYEDRGGGVYVVTQEMIDAAGWKTTSLYVAKEDGTDYPLVISGADEIPAGWIALKRIDNLTVEQTEKRANPGFGGGNAGGGAGTRVVSRGTRKLSPDGKTLTLTVTAAGGGGGDDAAAGIAAAAAARGEAPQKDADVIVFEKQ